MTQVLRFFAAIALLALAPCALATFLPPARLLVVTDGNYPPYVFRGDDGQLRGLLKDRWDAWSKATGIPVELEGIDWALAQERVRNGEADVIAAIAFSEGRAKQFEFGRGGDTPIDARVFFHKSLGGIHDVSSLRGLAVGAKAGSACGEWLGAHGVPLLRTYPDSRGLVEAAGHGEVRLFCMDSPTARYLLAEQELAEEFREAPPLYTATLDWAVRKGRGDLRDFVQRGFERIPPSTAKAIDARWLGDPVRSSDVGRYSMIAAGICAIVVLVLWLRNRYLHHHANMLSTLDVVTGLPNRAAGLAHLRDTLARVGERRRVVLMLVSVERQKAVRDAYGEQFGDRILQEAAARLSADAAGAYLAFAGGEDFALVLPGFEWAEDALPWARRAIAALQRPYDLDGARVYCGASAGLAVHPRDGADAATLMQNAGIALAIARQGKGDAVRFFAPDMQAAATGRVVLETALRGALDRGEFVLHYQPRYEAHSGDLVGFEALLRWNHPERGLLPPAEFITVLEETGAIAAVGEWVFRRTCEQLGEWERAGLQPLPVAVNLSATQFRDRGLDVTIARVIAETGVNAGLLELELTESTLMHDPEEAERMLRHLESFGLKLSIDDFGTGYSSLAYLKRFPLDSLKIDRTFVRDATTNPDDAAITKAIIQLAHTLGLRVVAEGVETAEQRELLCSLECDEVQGFLFARPMPAEEAGRLLPPGLASLRRSGT